MRLIVLTIFVLSTMLIACKGDKKIQANDAVVEDYQKVNADDEVTVLMAEDTINWVGTYKASLNGVKTSISLGADKSATIEFKNKRNKTIKTVTMIEFDPSGSFYVELDGDNREYKIIDGGVIDVNTMMDNLGKEEVISEETLKRFTLLKE